MTHCLVCGDEAPPLQALRLSAGELWSARVGGLCDYHAASGCVVEIAVRPTVDGRVVTLAGRWHGGPRDIEQHVIEP